MNSPYLNQENLQCVARQGTRPGTGQSSDRCESVSFLIEVISRVTAEKRFLHFRVLDLLPLKVKNAMELNCIELKLY